MKKRVFLYRVGAFGDQIHCSSVVRAYHEDGWEVSMLYNHKGAQIHSYNPMIKHHQYYEASAKGVTRKTWQQHQKEMTIVRDSYDRFISFQKSLEHKLIYEEDSPEYFWPHWKRRARSENLCFYDHSMKWAGLTAPKYMGRTGDVFFKKQENNLVLDWLEPYKDKFIILWAIRGSMYQKAMYPISKEICSEFVRMHPETVIITTGDDFCQQFEWEGKNVIHRSGRMPFRQALCMAQYVDLVVTPETGLGIGAGSFGTPKIMLLTAASLTNIVGNDKNDYSLQSPAWCSPCFRAIYNTDNCHISDSQRVNGANSRFIVKSVDPTSLEYGLEREVSLPICVDFPKEMVLARMEEVYQAKHERIWRRHESEEPQVLTRPNERNDKKSDASYGTPPRSSIHRAPLDFLVKIASTAPPGDFAEIGVYRGGSAWRLDKVCRLQSRTLHLFDTFEGMPHQNPNLDVLPVGWFSGYSKDHIEATLPDAKIYKGVYPDTLPNDLDNIAFVHIDCDQYESVKASIQTMIDRLVPGGIMYFDDYSEVPGAKKAIDEVLADDFITIHGGTRAVWIKPTVDSRGAHEL